MQMHVGAADDDDCSTSVEYEQLEKLFGDKAWLMLAEYNW